MINFYFDSLLVYLFSFQKISLESYYIIFYNYVLSNHLHKEKYYGKNKCFMFILSLFFMVCGNYSI